MNDRLKLFFVKLLHTLVWIFFNVVLVYMFYAVITGRLDQKFWIAVGLIAVEGFVLLINNWTCPLSPIARKYTDSTRANFDIFIPNWIAKHNILIYSILLVILISIAAWNGIAI